MKKIVILLSLMIASSITWADTASIDRSGFYAGAKFGQVDTPLGVKTNTWAINGGYNINQYISTELSYTSAVNFSIRNVDLDWEVYQIAIIPTYPINDDWSVTGRLGYSHNHWDYLIADVDMNELYSVGGSSNEFVWGVGLTRHIGQTFVRLEYDNIDNADFLALGFGVRF